MAINGPAFPESLPSRPSYFQPPQRPAPTKPSAESGRYVNIILGFLAFGLIGNIALTLYTHREREIVKAAEQSNKEAQILDELNHVRSELVYARKLLSDHVLEINRIKVGYQTVLDQVRNVSTPTAPKYVPNVPMNNTEGIKPSVEKQ